MSVVRSHRYHVADGDLEEFLSRRGALIEAVRQGHPGLTHAVLIRLEDGVYTDTWHWESGAQMGAAFASLPTIAEAPLTMALTSDATALNGQVVDER